MRGDDADPRGFDLLPGLRRPVPASAGHKDLPDQPELYGAPKGEREAAAYAEMLARQPWHWFVTLTFRPKHESASGGMHPEKADKAFRVLLSKINREVYGVRWYKRPDGGLVWARGQEFHKNGRIHFHAVCSAPTDDLNSLTRRMRWVDWWWEEFGIARIERPESQADVNRYVSKYVTKDGEVDFSPNYGRYVPPALVYGNGPPPRGTSSTRASAAVAKRTGDQAAGESGNRGPLASRCLTPQYRPQRLLLNRQHETETRRQLTTDDDHEDHDQEHRRSP